MEKDFVEAEPGLKRIEDDDAMLANMQAIQKRNNLPQTSSLENRHFNIKMETGTGKIYVYTKTIFELHKRFGFTKFIIVVPSVAIHEGVFKSFQSRQEHFGLQYDNAPCRYFTYNSARLSDVRQFATSATIEIMIINIDAFKKSENVFNQAQDRLSGESAMRFRDLNNNPQLFIERCVEIINNRLHHLDVDGISYLKLEGNDYHSTPHTIAGRSNGGAKGNFLQYAQSQ